MVTDWRVEPNIKMFCDVMYDPFKFMRECVGFLPSGDDFPFVVQGEEEIRVSMEGSHLAVYSNGSSDSLYPSTNMQRRYQRFGTLRKVCRVLLLYST